MPRTNSTVWNVVLPIILFVPLSAAAFNFLMVHMVKAGLLKSHEQCPSPWTGQQPFQLKYLGGYAPPVEQTLCILVNFFHPLFQPHAADHVLFVHEFLASIAAPIAVTIIEASRANRPLLLAAPLIWGAVYQNIGAGVIFPIYWAVLLATTRGRAAGSQIDKTSAESVLFALLVGFVAPTVAMAYFTTVEPIAFWQAFPLWISVSQFLYRLFRSSPSGSTSGYRTIQTIYALIFLVSSAAYLRHFSSHEFDLRAIADAYLPEIAIPDAAKGHTSLTSSIHFLQWDYVFIFGSTFLASLWFAESVLQGVLLTAWSVAITPVLGAGAAVSGIFIWREAKLKQKRQKQVPAIKRAKAQ